METLPYEIILEIIDKCDFLSAIRLSCVNILFYKKIQIFDLLNIPQKYHFKINDEILRQKKFVNLKKLNAQYYISQNVISKLNLVELNACNNRKIKKVC